MTSANATTHPHRQYRLDVPQARSADQADIFSFDGERAIGQPTRYVIRFTHTSHDLSRSEYLNKPASLVIQPRHDPSHTREPEPERRVQGVITGFTQQQSSRDQSTYEVVLESRLALLRNAPKSRFFLDASFPEIIEKILREHQFDMILGRFEFNLYREYRKRAFVMQWEEDDLTFITRLCRRSGIWFVCEEGKHCETVRFGDDLTHYRRVPNLTVLHKEYSGLNSNGAESVHTLKMHAKTIPASYAVRAYDYRNAPIPVESTNLIHDDRTTYGETYTWGTARLSKAEAEQEALLRREAALAGQVLYEGTGDMLDLTPASVVKLSNRDLPDAKYGLLAVSVKCSASRSSSYHVAFTAIPCDRLYRLPLMEHTWPRIHGSITGYIASPGDYKEPYVDENGEYIVSLHLDRDERRPGLNSCPMRLAKPFAGADETGFHFGLVEGAEVTVAFHHGNPDMPYISQVLHNSRDPDPIVSTRRWNSRSTLRTRSNNTFEFEDWPGEEHIKVATEQGKTQLNLGYTVNRDRKFRGNGFELRTDLKGCVRAGGGMLLSAYMQARAVGEQTDMEAALDHFRATLAQAQELADVARAAQAENVDVKGENRWLKEELAGLKKAVIALSAPDGIGLSTPNRVLVAAGNDISAATSSAFNVSAMKNVVVAAGGMLSMFVHRLGIKLFASRGNIDIQAHSDEIRIASNKNTTITSSNGSVVIEAKEKLILKCGGSYICITSSGIEDGTKGNRTWRASGLHGEGPRTMPSDLPVLPQPIGIECARHASHASVPFARI
ncbi:type VI secretion system tip protein VgrG [Paraburkholderia edwinii]|uniref:Type VI secretion system tip protein VgrG n=1 Tax=Paraburkholderia edwinii TaxID=2861782 RepID=A0ABX8UIU6_9BURK|nr:type VI secretion system Vgr family protein [Paraburkholderia edwinii]QYD68272.1 type VI secretion system tip protein VgrG [Paraburkholderia edwinii]